MAQADVTGAFVGQSRKNDQCLDHTAIVSSWATVLVGMVDSLGSELVPDGTRSADYEIWVRGT